MVLDSSLSGFAAHAGKWDIADAQPGGRWSERRRLRLQQDVPSEGQRSRAGVIPTNMTEALRRVEGPDDEWQLAPQFPGGACSFAGGHSLKPCACSTVAFRRGHPQVGGDGTAWSPCGGCVSSSGIILSDALC